MKRSIRILFVLVVIAALCGFALILFSGGPSSPLPPLPNPNGYDDLVKAGEVLTDDLPDFLELRDMSDDELRTAFTATSLAKHGEAIAFAKVGLGRTCRVPLDYDATSSAHLGELSAIKRVARVFIVQGRLAEMENHGVDAANSYLDLIRLGHESARGGVVLDSMSGRAVEALGLACLEKLTPKLNAKSCREMASALETIDERSESLEVVQRQEARWARRTYGLRGQFTRLLTYRLLKKSEQQWTARMKGQQSRRQSLAVKLAALSYELEKGARPTNFADLVPEYLKAIPQDLLAGTNLVYTP